MTTLKPKDTTSETESRSPSQKRQKLSQSPSEKNVDASASNNAQPLPGHGMFSGINAFVLQAGIGKARTEIFKKQLAKHGACVQMKMNDKTSHVIVDEEMNFPRFCRIMRYEESSVPAHLKIVKAKWLSYCLSEGKLTDEEEFILLAPIKMEKVKLFPTDDRKSDKIPENREGSISKQQDRAPSDGSKLDGQIADVPGTSKQIPGTGGLSTSPTKRATAARGSDSDDSNYVPSDDEEDDGNDVVGAGGGLGDSNDETGGDAGKKAVSSEGYPLSGVSSPDTSPSKLPRGHWVCSRPSTAQKDSHHNQHIIEKLEILMKAYENTQDRWRALGYKKAISALKNYGKDVTTWEEANSIPGIGTKLADKIWEIIESGHLRKIDYVCKGEDMEAIDLFNNVWGAGPTVARDWVQQGFRTLDDLRGKAKLTKQQQIGLKHYHEFLDRMPREEAGTIERTVRETAELLFPGMLAVVCGSYRRGKQTCGDVDVLITHPDGKSHKGALLKILDVMRQTGFITDDLIRVEEKGEQKKYMGVCKLPGESQKHRRIDIIVAPYPEYPCALVHFTGSGHFNRSMRALAKKKGMSLSEHALRTGVVRRGQEKIHEGTPLPVNSEKDIFDHLGLDYREPHERDY